MIDVSKTIEPKSDQLNADDLIAGPKKIEITGVKLGDAEQPIHIHYKGDNGRPYKPCKGMRRVMVSLWGKNGDDYIGKSMVLYCDTSVTWAGQEIGGIRISHMTGITEKKQIAITKSKGKRIPVVIEPLIIKPRNKLSDECFNDLAKGMEDASDMAGLAEISKQIKLGHYDDDGAARLRAEYDKAMKRIRCD